MAQTDRGAVNKHRGRLQVRMLVQYYDRQKILMLWGRQIAARAGGYSMTNVEQVTNLQRIEDLMDKHAVAGRGGDTHIDRDTA